MTAAAEALTVHEVWDAQVDRRSDAPFLTWGDDTYSYGAFDESLNQLANGLRAQGVKRGDRVALLLPNGLSLLRHELALQKLGAVMVPLIAGSSPVELSYVLHNCLPSHLVTTNEGWATLAGSDALASLPTRCYVENRPSGIGHDLGPFDASVLESDDPTRPPAPQLRDLDPMALMYTSGSTGRPKGVLQPQAGFISAGRAISARLGLSSEDGTICTTPLFHTGATLVQLAPAITSGGRFALEPGFSRTNFWNRVRETASTVGVLVPAQLSILMTAPRSDNDRGHGLRASISQTRPAAFIERFGVEICPIWSMTESCGMGALSEPGFVPPSVSFIGPPMEGAEFRIVGAADQSVPTGTVGEITFRHRFMATGYYEDPVATASAFTNGWLHTGDLGSLDDAGSLSYHGRLKNVIKRAGENIAGEELEKLIMEHSAVEECIVTGVPDPIYTEEVFAAVVVRAGHPLVESDVTQWVAERLISWKVPRYVRLVTEPLPKLANGKTDRGRYFENLEVGDTWDRVAATADGGPALSSAGPQPIAVGPSTSEEE